MLVLSRKQNQTIVIADCITVRVVEIRGNSVRLGVTAAKDVSIHRGEVQAAVEREREIGKKPPLKGGVE